MNGCQGWNNQKPAQDVKNDLIIGNNASEQKGV